jgi:hypothetical protein
VCGGQRKEMKVQPSMLLQEVVLMIKADQVQSLTLPSAH